MSKRHTRRERAKGLNRSYAYKGARYVVYFDLPRDGRQLLFVRDSVPRQYYVWDAQLRARVGESTVIKAEAEKRARLLNETVR